MNTWYTNDLKNTYKWNVDGNWSTDELRRMNETATAIQAYADKITGGNGLDWMKKNMGGTTIAHPNPIIDLFAGKNRNTSWPWHTIYLAQGFQNFDLAHEMAEMWDLNTATGVTTGGYSNGVADQLNAHMGGNIMSDPWTCRYCNPNNYLGNIPNTNKWGDGSYANTATEDYFSESFSHMLYPLQVSGSYNMPAGIQTWLNEYITQGGPPAPPPLPPHG